jgi:RAMP superfamily
MRYQLQNIQLTLTLEAPFLVQGGIPSFYGIDASELLDETGTPVIPGTLLAGRVREFWAEHGDSNGFPTKLQNRYLGQSGVGERSDRQAKLRLKDLKLLEIDYVKFDPATVRPTQVTRIAIDDDLGSVRAGQLLVIEQIAKAKSSLSFSGTWQIWATQEEANELSKRLRWALLSQTQLGAYRNVGFGRLKAVVVAVIQATPVAMLDIGDAPLLHLSLAFNEPFCVATTNRRGNVFESADYLPGSVILGALAQTICDAYGVSKISDPSVVATSTLAKYFDKIRVLNAYPTQQGASRAVPFPLSLTLFDENIVDAFRWENPPPLSGEQTAPTFSVDWKYKTFKKVQEKLGVGSSEKVLRVRTAISGGQAKEGDLFAYSSRYSTKTRWCSMIDLRAVTDANDRVKLLTELKTFLAFGLSPIGKTDATAAVEIKACIEGDDLQMTAINSIKEGDLVRVVLNGDAALFATDEIANKSGVDMKAIYQKAFTSMSSASTCGVMLSHCFARQKLYGGSFFLGKYPKMGNPFYQPATLTEKGSVFVFNVNNAALAKKTFTSWATLGLGIPESVADCFGASWKTNPFLSQNGFGEVSINLPLEFPELSITQSKANV